MTQPDKDWNRLAALLDDRLAERDRDEALAHLSLSDEDAGDFADAAATLRELEEEDGVVITPRVVAENVDTDVPALVGADVDADVDADVGEHAGAKVIPLRPPSTTRRWRRPPARWLALAAVIVGVLVVLPVTRFGGGAGDPGQYAALLENEQAGIPPNWRDAWGGTRGSGDVAADKALAARLGAQHMDLEVAVRARQKEQTQYRADRIVNTLSENVTAGGTASPPYSDISQRAGEPPEALAEQLEEGRENVAMLVGEDYFGLGAWAEAARIAARRQDTEFFRARASRRMLDRAASMSSLDAEERSALEAIRTAVQGNSPIVWTDLEAHAEQLLGNLARG